MAAAEETITLLSSVLLPKKDGTREMREHRAGETVKVPAKVAERFLRIGVAEKSGGRKKAPAPD